MCSVHQTSGNPSVLGPWPMKWLEDRWTFSIEPCLKSQKFVGGPVKAQKFSQCLVHSWALTLSSQPWRWMPAVLRHQPGQVSEMVSCDDKRDPSCCYCSEEMSQKIVLRELSFRLIDSFIYQSGGYPEGYCSRFLKKKSPTNGVQYAKCVIWSHDIWGAHSTSQVSLLVCRWIWTEAPPDNKADWTGSYWTSGCPHHKWPQVLPTHFQTGEWWVP